jgi:2-polyprenyl-3-methyl-5-hydroxy-6-metoxy-1,4-benzoquinol methylase
MKALEFGAGTGLMSFLLKDQFKSITLIDNSSEMINMIRLKIKDQAVSHMHPLRIDLEHDDFGDTFDIIYSQMAFHHVVKLDLVISKLIRMLRSPGTLVIADLYPEDGSFHGEGFTGHNGFDPDRLSALLQTEGLEQIRYRKCYTVKKTTATGRYKEYPVFLLKAVKS